MESALCASMWLILRHLTTLWQLYWFVETNELWNSSQIVRNVWRSDRSLFEDTISVFSCKDSNAFITGVNLSETLTLLVGLLKWVTIRVIHCCNLLSELHVTTERHGTVCIANWLQICSVVGTASKEWCLVHVEPWVSNSRPVAAFVNHVYSIRISI